MGREGDDEHGPAHGGRALHGPRAGDVAEREGEDEGDVGRQQRAGRD